MTVGKEKDPLWDRAGFPTGPWGTDSSSSSSGKERWGTEDALREEEEA